MLIFGDSAPVGVGDLLGTPLRFLYGHDVFTLRNANALDQERFAEVIRVWQRAGRSVYWVGMAEGLAWPLAGSMLGSPTDHRVTVTILEQPYDHKPTARDVIQWQIPLAEVSRDGE